MEVEDTRPGKAIASTHLIVMQDTIVAGREVPDPMVARKHTVGFNVDRINPSVVVGLATSVCEDLQMRFVENASRKADNRLTRFPTSDMIRNDKRSGRRGRAGLRVLQRVGTGKVDKVPTLNKFDRTKELSRPTVRQPYIYSKKML